MGGYHPLGSLIEVVDSYIVATLANRTDYAPVIIFSLTIGGMIGIIARFGWHPRYGAENFALGAKPPRSGIICHLGPWGVVIFFR